MSKVIFDPDETVLAELSPTRRSVFFPVVELLLITGMVWLAIGVIDGPVATAGIVEPPLLWVRWGLLVLWLWLAWRRCVRHLIYRARSRVLLTDRRLITASGHVRSRIAEIPTYNIVDARATGSRVSIVVAGQRVPVVLGSVPKAKKFARLVRTIVVNRDDRFQR